MTYKLHIVYITCTYIYNTYTLYYLLFLFPSHLKVNYIHHATLSLNTSEYVF